MRDLRAEIAELDEQILLCESFEEFEEMRVLIDRRIRLKAAELEDWTQYNGTAE